MKAVLKMTLNAAKSPKSEVVNKKLTSPNMIAVRGLRTSSGITWFRTSV